MPLSLSERASLLKAQSDPRPAFLHSYSAPLKLSILARIRVFSGPWRRFIPIPQNQDRRNPPRRFTEILYLFRPQRPPQHLPLPVRQPLLRHLALPNPFVVSRPAVFGGPCRTMLFTLSWGSGRFGRLRPKPVRALPVEVPRSSRRPHPFWRRGGVSDPPLPSPGHLPFVVSRSPVKESTDQRHGRTCASMASRPPPPRLRRPGWPRLVLSFDPKPRPNPAGTLGPSRDFETTF